MLLWSCVTVVQKGFPPVCLGRTGGAPVFSLASVAEVVAKTKPVHPRFAKDLRLRTYLIVNTRIRDAVQLVGQVGKGSTHTVDPYC